jgi:MbtH protein
MYKKILFITVAFFSSLALAWDDDNTLFNVVINHEEQYSIWPVDRELPLGWKKAGKSGTKMECLEYIEEVWTDMRPLSLRKQMQDNPDTN